MESSENERTMDDLRTLFWTICFVLGLFFVIGFFIYCIIKCDENKKKKGENDEYMSHLVSDKWFRITLTKP